MDKVALFPGSFDPFTVGHESLVKRGLQLFDRIVIAVGENADKKNLFSIEMRMKMISRVFEERTGLRLPATAALRWNSAAVAEHGTSSGGSVPQLTLNMKGQWVT